MKYEINYTKGLEKVLTLLVIVTVLGGLNQYLEKKEVSASTSATEPSPAVYSGQDPAGEEVSVATPSATLALEFNTEVEAYIYEVFGPHYDMAMLLLKGNGDCGGENRTLNPSAVNDNTVWGGVGRDRGVFQINSVYHPLTDEQAFDYRKNIEYAFRMFENDNYTFVRWTAGRCMGI